MSTTWRMIGRAPISTRALGTDSVFSRRRVPRPPQRITTGGSSALPAGDGRQDRDLVAVVDGGLEALLEADVLAGDVDVHEAAQVAVLGDPLAKAVVAIEHRVEGLADGGRIDFHLGLAIGGRT